MAGAGGSGVSVRSGVLVGSNGHTLYLNTVDTSSHISCVGQCASQWPPVTGPVHLGSGLSAADFGTAKRPDGSRQETYLGHPLYEFAGDHAAGQRSGNGVRDGGGMWHAAVVGGAMPTGGGSSGGGYSGY
jgi:predicted lipoprotein with Yx(FWY)xxD motif